ncbi:MAG: S-layer homology domain-containing protein, partial [Clostridiales bacterium]|nr:S-layer homology domain-containing protein [Clostridiales bacterium]
MKKLNKILSVGLSLAMCVSMVAPAFAASFDDLQMAINGGAPYNQETGADLGNGRYGYGNALNEEKTQYEIEAWDEGDTRKIELNADVQFEKDGDDANRKDAQGNGAIYVWRSDKDVSIELNGHDIDMNPDAELNAEDGKFYDEDGNVVNDADLNNGTVIKVTSGANLTITDSSEEGTGKITGGNAHGGNDELRRDGVGAVYVDQNSSFTMNGGSISGNRSDQSTLCAENPKDGNSNSTLNVALHGVTVENNRTERAGTIYFVAKSGNVNVTIDGCEITGNVAEGDVIDFGLHENGQSLTATVKDTTIKGNTVDKDNVRGDDHGAVALWQNNGKTLDITFDGCTIQGNGGGCAGIYYHNENGDGLKIVVDTNTICGNAGEKGNGVSVMYKDGTKLDAMHTAAYWEAINPEIIKEATCAEPGVLRYTCPFCNVSHETEIPVNPDAHDMGEWYVSIPAQPGVEGEERRDCQRECGHFETRPIPALPVPETDTTVEIDDVDVPLAGIFTRADAIGYLWEQSGSPEWELSDFEDVPEDHYWAVAIGWAEDMGIAVADEDGNFRPDDLV